MVMYGRPPFESGGEGGAPPPMRQAPKSKDTVKYCQIPGVRSPGYCFGRWALLAESGWGRTRLET